MYDIWRGHAFKAMANERWKNQKLENEKVEKQKIGKLKNKRLAIFQTWKIDV